jgi:AcrR family transcriptional regulator
MLVRMSLPSPTRRSDRTRAAILDAAKQRFGTDGYERATIRAIAADAGIDPAMVMRYYGNKERLFAAAAEFDLRLPVLTTRGREEAGAFLLAHLFDRWEGDEALMALLRASMNYDVAAERIRDIFAMQLVPHVAAFTGDGSSAGQRAGLIASQMLGLALCRYILRLPAVATMSRAEIIEEIGPTIQRYLTD